MPKILTDEFLIEELHRFVRENGRIPKMREFTPDNGYPSYGTYATHFGSFNNAVIIAGYEPNQTHHIEKLDGTETCNYCGKRADEIEKFTHWHYDKNDVRYCKKHGESGRGGKPDYVIGNLDINSEVGLGRAGELLVKLTLNIKKEFDYNVINGCNSEFDLYNVEYGKIDVKTCKLFNKHRWTFNFNKRQDANTYICIGLSSNRSDVEHVWIVPNVGKIRNTSGITIVDTYYSLSNHEKLEVDSKSYNEAWKTMKLKTCKIMTDKKKEESEEEKLKFEKFKKAYFKKLGITE